MKIRAVFLPSLFFFLAVGVSGLPGAVGPARMPDENPEGETGALKGQVELGGGFDAHSGNATRVVNDLHVPGALGMYGLDFTRYWNSVPNNDDNEAAELPVDFADSGWSHSWRWAAVYNEEISGDGESGLHRVWTTSITITYPDGHASKFKILRVNFGDGAQPLRMGPPYVGGGEINWPSLGATVHDFLAEMAPDGHEFWLHRGDGGTVHFVGVRPERQSGDYAWWHYEAREIFDPHGFKTDLSYDEQGYLYRVSQEGGRSLKITWGVFPGYVVPFITKVETDGFAAGQSVIYRYTHFPYPDGGSYVLAGVGYPNQPAPGQTTWAGYTYGNCLGDVEPCPGQYQAYPPLLKTAYDPHYAGAMTKIKYNYGGGNCPFYEPGPTPPPVYYDNVFFLPQAVAAEKSAETGAVVASFQSGCGGLRSVSNGFGGTRKLYFGQSAHDNSISAPGYMLTKVTDFAFFGVSPISRKQKGAEPVKAWDGRGIETDFAWDISGRPFRADYADGSNCTYNRTDSSGSAPPDLNRMHYPNYPWLYSNKDENDKVTTYRRDHRRRITRVEYADTSYETFEYDNNNPNGLNLVTQHRLPSGATKTYEYDPITHLLVREYNSVEGWSQRKEYTYDALGRLETTRDGRAIADGAAYTTRMEYNGRHQILKIHYRPTGFSADPTVTYEYDNYGNRTAIIDEMGHRQEDTYDSYRRRTSHTEWVNGFGPDGSNMATRRWDWIYDRVIDGAPDTYGASTHTSSEWRVQIEPAFDGTGKRRMTNRTFDVNNRMTSEQTGWIQPPGEISVNNPWYQGSEIETHYFTYDENGQKSSYTDPRGRVTTYEYNNRNRLWKTNETVNSVPRTTETFYDRAGNKTLVKFPENNGVIATQEWPLYDAFGQPRQFKDELGTMTYLNYWPWGPMKKLAQVITQRQRDDGQSETQLTEFFPDGLGRPWRTQFPDGSAEESYYLFGQLSSFKTRREQWKTIGYDARGREITHSWSDGTPGVSRAWDDASRLLSISNIFSTIDYGYDDAGQVKYEGSDVNGSGARREVRYWRYPNGNVAKVIYPNGLGIERSYTERGQLKTVKDSSQDLVTYHYFKDGKVEFQSYGNGMETVFGYDDRGFTGSVTHRRGATEVAKRTYWRDKRDRIVAWEKGVNPSANPRETGLGDRYEYDEAGQLTRAAYQAENAHVTAANPERADDFHYDAMGNRQGWNRVASRGGLMEFKGRNNKLNQYESWANDYSNPPDHWGVVMWYDDAVTDPPSAPWVPYANGVLMGDGWNVAGFNALNQPSSMWSFAYQGTPNWMFFGYDPLGRCVKRWVGSSGAPETPGGATYFYYDGSNLIQEGSTATTVDRTYVHGGRVDEIVASAAGAGPWLYHHFDARGHCIMLTNGIGGIVEQYEYDAFGQPYVYNASGVLVNRKFGSPAGNRFLFTGREWLKDMRVYDFRARLYQPELGRFLQPDPKQFGAGDYNLYRYCHNDPVNKSDPTGLQDEITNKPNLTMTGQGDWAQVGSPFTNGDRLSAAKNYEREIKGIVDKALKEANAHSSHVKWSASINNVQRSAEYFKKAPLATAITELDAKSTAVKDVGSIASFNINLKITINWNEARSGTFTTALGTTDMEGPFHNKTGEIAHTRDIVKAVNSPYGTSKSAVDIANRTAGSMVGFDMSGEDASAQMDNALTPWVRSWHDESKKRDLSGEHLY